MISANFHVSRILNYLANDPNEHNKKLLEKFLNIQYDSFQHFTDPTASQLFLILTRKCVFFYSFVNIPLGAQAQQLLSVDL